MKNLSLLVGLLVVMSACNVTDDNGDNTPLQGPALRANFAGTWDVILSSTAGDAKYISEEMAPALTAPTEAVVVDATGNITLTQTEDTVNNIYVYDEEASKFFTDGKTAVFAVTYNRVGDAPIVEHSPGFMQVQITSKNEVRVSVPFKTEKQTQNTTLALTRLATISLVSQ